jgi:predicted MPP superfamily phosphohydrolase
MHQRQADPIRGMAVSDLHLFAHRSAGREYFGSLRSQLISADLLVLNGDIFDFRWSTLATPEITAHRAVEWLQAVRDVYPCCAIHYVLGNHDCPAFFRERLNALAKTLERFQWHEYGVRIGTALFVHGDCTHRRMNPAGLRKFRKEWDNDRHHGRGWRTRAYVAGDRLGVTRVAHQLGFPRGMTVARAMHYLDQASPAWRVNTRNVYFGHTHQPFSNHPHGDILFHNTGSAIRGMGFNPLAFSVPAMRIEPLNPISAEELTTDEH